MLRDNVPAVPANETKTPQAETSERNRRATIRAAILSVPLVLTLSSSASAAGGSGYAS